MSQLVCHELALKMNWSDKYKNKHAFGKLKKIPGIVNSKQNNIYLFVVIKWITYILF